MHEAVDCGQCHGRLDEYLTPLRERRVGLDAQALVLLAGITALYRKPNTSRRTPGHTIWPYLLRTLAITRSNHV
jgi:hypothetical protein